MTKREKNIQDGRKAKEMQLPFRRKKKQITLKDILLLALRFGIYTVR